MCVCLSLLVASKLNRNGNWSRVEFGIPKGKAKNEELAAIRQHNNLHQYPAFWPVNILCPSTSL